MNLFPVWLSLFAITACNTRNKPVQEVSDTPEHSGQVRHEQVFPAVNITRDTGIINQPGRKISLLYNSMVNRFHVTDTIYKGFETECMPCEPVQEYNGHLLFANRLEIFYDKTIYHDTDLTVSPNAFRVSFHGSAGREGKPRSFPFAAGTGMIRYLGQSCNDASLNTVVLKYKEGTLTIGNMLNALFFEFDMNKDGVKEQYILSTRNCTQELAVILVE